MKALILLRDIYSIISLTLIMKALILLRDIYSIISLTLIMKALILLSDIYSIISLTLIMKALILLRDIYSIISLTLIMKALILLRDIYSIISLTDIESFDLTEGYLQYHQPDWYWKLWSYWGIFTVSSAWLILKALILLRDIYSIISLTDNESFDITERYLQYHQPDWYWKLWSYWGIFTVSSAWLIMKALILLRDIYSIIVCIDTFDLTEGYLQHHRMYCYLWSYWGIFTVSLCVLIPVVLLRDIYSIIVCIDTFDLTEGYLQYHRIYWYLWSYWEIFTVSSYVLIHLILLRDIYSIICIVPVGLILLRDIYSIIVCIDTFDLTEGYLQYHGMHRYL